MVTIDTRYPVSILLPFPKAVQRNTPFPYDPNNPLKTLTQYIGDEPLAQFLVKIKSKSLSKYPFAINPVSLCYEVWSMWSSSTDKILSLCRDDLLASL